METDAALGSDFFPRPQISGVLAKRLTAFHNDYRQNVGLISRKFLGKSSILRNFLLTMDLDKIVPIYVEIGQEPFEQSVHKWMGAVLYGVLRTRKTPVPEGRRAMIRRAKAIVPRTFDLMRRIRRALRQSAHEAAFERTLRLTTLVAEETHRKVVLVIDEFHRLGQFELDQCFQMLGRQIMTEKDTMYVVASSEPDKARHIFQEQLALLFGNFEVLEIQPFDFGECQLFIRHRLGRSDLRKPLEHFLVRLTDGNPYYLDILLRRMKLIGKDHWLWRLNENVMVEALVEELFHKSGLFHVQFSSTIELLGRGRASSCYLEILMALALGHKKVRGICRFTTRGVQEVKKILTRLMEVGLVSKHGSFYTLVDPFFQFWLAEVYWPTEQCLDYDHSRLSDRFRSRVHEWVRSYETYDALELPERVVGLFKRFQNDVIMLNEKRYLCPRFDKVSSRPSNGRVFPVYAECFQGRWMAQVVHERMTEEDVRQFTRDEERLPKRVRQRIMIALKGADLNAKLLAKEFGLAVWNLKQLNQLLKLYGEPKVIL